jgi:hypothetical protein
MIAHHGAKAVRGRADMKIAQSLLAAVLGLAAPYGWACYTVYDAAGHLVYNDPSPPVDMSRPLHDTLPARFPGGHMVFDLEAACSEVQSSFAPVASAGSAALLTDRRTAEAMNVPYTMLAGGIALVQPGPRMRPGVTVVPAQSVAQTPAVRGTVITELRDPPVTIVESGGRVLSNGLIPLKR